MKTVQTENQLNTEPEVPGVELSAETTTCITDIVDVCLYRNVRLRMLERACRCLEFLSTLNDADSDWFVEDHKWTIRDMLEDHRHRLSEAEEQNAPMEKEELAVA